MMIRTASAVLFVREHHAPVGALRLLDNLNLADGVAVSGSTTHL